MDEHPFRTAWRTRDLDAWGEALAPNVVLNSPLIRSPFTGRDTAVELFDVLFDVFGNFEVTEEFVAGESRSFFWQGEIGARTIEGVDLIRHDTDGKIAEITVSIRPLVSLAAFTAAIGPPLAGKRSRILALVARVVTLPLIGLLTIVDLTATRLAQRRA